MFAKLKNILLRRYKTTALIGGALSALVFPPVYLWQVFMPVLLGMWCLCNKLASYKQTAALGYFYGFGFFAAGFYWVGNALLIDIATFGWLYPIALAAAGAFFGLFMILPFVMWRFSGGIIGKVAGFAAAWVLMEWLRSFLLTGFPWNMLGTAWAFHPVFIQTAALWGTYGLSFIMLIWCGTLYGDICGGSNKYGAAFILIPVLLLGFGAWRIHNYPQIDSDITVRLVQPSIPQQMKWNRESLEDNFYQYVNMSAESGLDKVDFVIWGETAMPFSLDYDNVYRQEILQAVPPRGYLITGALRQGDAQDDYNYFNSLFVLNKKGDIEGFYDKHHLVPFGEYIPLRRFLPKWVRPVTNAVADFGVGKQYKNIKLEKIPAFGALICYEIIFPDEVINRANPPQWLVVLTNDGWYGNSAGPYQHLVAAQMRAVEEGIAIVRSANSGISAVISPIGKILKDIPLNKKGVVDVKLPYHSKISTFYGSIGSKTINALMLLILCILIIYKRLPNHTTTKNS
jgi:apolipoprotein N-acyltransferase